jgi:hypothetical protein
VVRDGHARRRLVGHLGQVGTLHPVLGVGKRVQVAGRQRGNSLGAHHHPSLLDDLEHLRDAVVHLADEPALGRYVVLAEGQLTGRRGLEAHLVFDVGDEDTVALAGLAGLEVEQELRHEEQRQTLGAGAGALRAGQHQVEDVLEEVIGIGGRDESLHAVDVPGTVVLLDGLGPAGTHVRAGVRLGEHHGRTPAALGGDDRPLLLLFGGQVVEDAGETGAAAVHPHRGVCSQQVLVQRPDHRLGNRRAAELLVDADLVPAGFGDRLDRLLERLGQGHRVRLGVEYGGIAVCVDE